MRFGQVFAVGLSSNWLGMRNVVFTRFTVRMVRTITARNRRCKRPKECPMHNMLIKGFVLAVAAAGMCGCASVEDVERAQATADAAAASAHQAGQTAATAHETAVQNKSDIDTIEPKVDKLVAMHPGPRG
jgi:hypothetical protein